MLVIHSSVITLLKYFVNNVMSTMVYLLISLLSPTPKVWYSITSWDIKQVVCTSSCSSIGSFWEVVTNLRISYCNSAGPYAGGVWGVLSHLQCWRWLLEASFTEAVVGGTNMHLHHVEDVVPHYKLTNGQMLFGCMHPRKELKMRIL